MLHTNVLYTRFPTTVHIEISGIQWAVSDHFEVRADPVIRAYRRVGIDPQELAHKNMRSSFTSYPNLWKLRQPDYNIDHHRVPNLQMFLKRNVEVLPISHDATGYQAGNLVTWSLLGNLPHICIVSNE